jgi:hypothetical protein
MPQLPLPGGKTMKPKKSISLLATVLGCCTSAIATFGFLFEQGGRIPSIRRTIGYDLTIIGAPGFVVGATVTGGHRTTLAAMAISGTILNAVFYFFVWLVILRLIQMAHPSRRE